MVLNNLAQDLITKVKQIPGYQNRVGFAVGGRDIDPINRNLTLPFAWIIYMGNQPEQLQPGNNQYCKELLRYSFIVKIATKNANSTTNITGDMLLQTYLPILDDTCKIIKSTSPDTYNGNKWRFEGEQLVEMDAERLVFDQVYSILVSA